MGKLIDLTGQRFGKLTVIKRAENKGKLTMWLCKCDCGNYREIWGCSLTRGASQSCGCTRAIANTSHGKTKTRLYRIWFAMNGRCRNPNNFGYKYYGGRGITVCEEWSNDFQAFYDWAMANGYRDDLTIDRKDTNGNYCPENCRWSTYQEQCNNKRNNYWITFDGVTRTLSDWATITGIPKTTLWMRIHDLNWSVERALTKTKN